MIIINEETIRESAAIIDKDNFLRSALSFAVLSAVSKAGQTDTSGIKV